LLDLGGGQKWFDGLGVMEKAIILACFHGFWLAEPISVVYNICYWQSLVELLAGEARNKGHAHLLP
jgi:hypothetical protein